MPKRINIIECDCGKRFEMNDDGSVVGAKESEWQLNSTTRLSNQYLNVHFVRFLDCPECYTTLKKQKATRRVLVTVDENTIEFTEE